MIYRIGHDNSGIGPAWHLNQVKIELSNGKVFVFPCNKWLDKSNAQDGRIERELFSKKLLMEDSKNLEQFIGSNSSSTQFLLYFYLYFIF